MQTIKAAGAADLLAYVWFSLGYRPRDSLLLVGLRGPRQQVGMVARVDLPPQRGRQAAARQLADMVAQVGDDAMIGIVASEDPSRLLVAWVKVLKTVARRRGLFLLDVLHVTQRGYGSLLCNDLDCCPPDGRPLSDVLESRLAAELVLEGLVLADDEADVVADVLPCDPPMQVPPLSTAALDPQARRAVVDRWAALVENLEDGVAAPGTQPGDDLDLAWVVPALEDLTVRDAVLFGLALGFRNPRGAAAQEAVLTGEDGKALALFDTAPPDRERITRGSALLAAVARSAPPGRRGEALAILAWVGWWTGRGARARLLCERALADIPGHRLATLVVALLSGGVPPPWVTRANGEQLLGSGSVAGLGEARDWAEW